MRERAQQLRKANITQRASLHFVSGGGSGGGAPQRVILKSVCAHVRSQRTFNCGNAQRQNTHKGKHTKHTHKRGSFAASALASRLPGAKHKPQRADLYCRTLDCCCCTGRCCAANCSSTQFAAHLGRPLFVWRRKRCQRRRA